MKLDFTEWLCVVITVYFIGLAMYVHEMTYGRGGFIFSENMPCCCYAEDGRTPVQCEKRPTDWTVKPPPR